MCGRFALNVNAEDLHEVFAVVHQAADFAWAPRFNIAPTQKVAAVRASAIDGQRELVLLKWGLIPFWAKDRAKGPQPINLRTETIAAKFGSLLKSRRCLVAATGFFEWEKAADTKGPKQPWHIRLKNGRPFGIAAVWDSWRDRSTPGSKPVETCALLTMAANDAIAPLHDRMPVILEPEMHDAWLDRTVTDVDAIQRLLEPVPADELERYRVSTLVNVPKNDEAKLIQPVDS